MSSNILVGILVYLVPFLILVCICMCCAMVRENRRNRMININQRNIPMSTERDNLIEQCSQHDHYSLPPPYTSETTTNFEESLPSYERAINRHS